MLLCDSGSPDAVAGRAAALEACAQALPAPALASPLSRPAVEQDRPVAVDPQAAGTAAAADDSAAPRAPATGRPSADPAAKRDGDPSDIVVRARIGTTPGDPLEAVNIQSFEMTLEVDKAVLRPMSLAFAKTVPSPLRDGLGNALANVREPVVFLNFLLQHKVGKAVETLSRFVINSTLGVAGLFDIAKRRPFRLPRRPNGLANTLGFYGVHAGPFLFVPLVGPITLRDLVGGVVDRLVVPGFFGRPFNQLYYTVPTAIFSELDHRAAFDEQLEMLHNDPANPYAATRAFYLQRREAEIEALHRKRRPSAGDALPGEAPANAPATPSGPAAPVPATLNPSDASVPPPK